ncbi:hypothetical protein PIIN_08553 [Serendipita indica DSM 11827]|uniref:ZZ-type domain-containing protein n=1 Tax=Serendipita indica (strain DSM 11827) TaxID=1109443 RepID=G4TTF8_SERID|nr:hypothetical protein PIIN_08553 [Serendipita indica DSM 11827]
MEVYIANGGVKKCDCCDKDYLVKFFTCTACAPHSSDNSVDICTTCCLMYAREAHQARCGPNHQFVFMRTRRQCGGCGTAISSDYMKCNNCSFDLCMLCTVRRRPMEIHQHTNRNHTFNYSAWLPHNKPGPIRTVQKFQLNWQWRCDVNGPGCTPYITGPFFHCLDCDKPGFDICAHCADFGGIWRHVRQTGHRFSFLQQESHIETSDPPPPYQPF